MVITLLSRAGDAPGYVLRVRSQLRLLVPEADIQIEPRSNTDVLIVLVGPRWATAPLDNQIVAALVAAFRARRQVIPVLVQGAKMPSESALPETIRPFATINAFSLRNESFAAGVIELLKLVRGEADRGPWREGGESGTLRIVSRHPGMALRLVSRFDGDPPISVRIDGVIYGSMHLFGDQKILPLAPGKHQVLLRHRWEDPVEVDVPANGTVTLKVSRNVVTGSVSVLGSGD